MKINKQQAENIYNVEYNNTPKGDEINDVQHDENHFFFDKLKTQIAQNEIDIVINKLMTYFKQFDKNEQLNVTILQASSLHSINLQYNCNLIALNEMQQQKAKINNVLLQLIDNEIKSLHLFVRPYEPI